MVIAAETSNQRRESQGVSSGTFRKTSLPMVRERASHPTARPVMYKRKKRMMNINLANGRRWMPENYLLRKFFFLGDSDIYK